MARVIRTPVISEKAWGIVNTKSPGPFLWPMYVRYGGDNASWNVFLDNNYYGIRFNDALEQAKKDGYRAIEVRIVPVESLIDVEVDD